jgi:flagellar protein FlbD
MIKLTRLNGQAIVVNADLIKFLEATPDTLLTLSNGEKLMVKESIETVMESFILFRRQSLEPVVRPLEIEAEAGL